LLIAASSSKFRLHLKYDTLCLGQYKHYLQELWQFSRERVKIRVRNDKAGWIHLVQLKSQCPQQSPLALIHLKLKTS